MSCTSTTIENTFEELPDEILLLICRYLSSADILFSFYGLNNRLTRTISDFYRFVVLSEISLTHFHFICTSILPNIGIHIQLLVVSNDWKGILSRKFLQYFHENISLIFPQLKRLILPTFRINSLMKFVDCLHNLSKLTEIKVMSLYEMENFPTESEILLDRVFTANENRLTSITFDDDCLVFIYQNTLNKQYLHIEKLVIELRTLIDLDRILTSLPNLQFFDVTVNEVFSISDDEMTSTINRNLTYFRLRSFIHDWNLNILIHIFKRIPNIEELIIEIVTDHDICLLDGEQIFSHISSSSLIKFSYFLQFDNAPSLDQTNIIRSWQQINQQVICLRNDDDDTVILYTIPFNNSSLILQYSLAKISSFADNYSPQVRSLTLYDISTCLTETFSILNKCHRLQRLIIQINEYLKPQSSQQVIPLQNLPYLTFFVALTQPSVNADDLKKLLEVSPNLYHLAVNFEFIQPMFNHESVCYLLEHRITHLLIGISRTTAIQSVADSINRLSIVFPRLRHLYFHPSSSIEPIKSLIQSVFQHLHQWKFLISFGIANITMELILESKDIRQWVIDNSSFTDQDSFITDYSDNTFRLWL